MGERLLCKQEVIGSIPFTSTTDRMTQSVIRVEARRERPGAEKSSEPRARCRARRRQDRSLRLEASRHGAALAVAAQPLAPLDATRVAS